MSTDRDIPEPPETAPDAARDAPKPDPVPDRLAAIVGASGPDGEAMAREWEGLAPDAMVLVPAFTPPPMRTPEHAWAMLVHAVGIIGDDDPDQRGTVDLFAGSWVPPTPPSGAYDGDLVLRLTPPTQPTHPLPTDHAADVEMLLACLGQWQLVGCWHGVDHRWPEIVAPTAKGVMALYIEHAETGIPRALTPPPPQLFYRRGALSELLEAGLVKAGDEFVWDRRYHRVRHTARVRADGTLVLADGRVCATPTGATTALGGVNQGGWTVFQRMSDGRTLAELRAQLQTRRTR